MAPAARSIATSTTANNVPGLRIQSLFRSSNHARMTDEKDDEPKRLAVFFCAQNIAAGELQCASIHRTRTKFLDGAHHGDMMQRAARILAVRNLGMCRVLRDNGEQRSLHSGR